MLTKGRAEVSKERRGFKKGMDTVSLVWVGRGRPAPLPGHLAVHPL